jgi:CDP-2,3-bis-(O-geranylgeranyl)-sn-glycerol synthase
MGFGAILGDAIGSFVKRRINIKPGAPFPIVDQIGFIFVAFILAEIFVNIPSTWWWVIPFTLVLHIGSNLIAYFFGWKEVWY